MRRIWLKQDIVLADSPPLILSTRAVNLVQILEYIY